MTFSRIRCLSGHLVGWILDPPYRKPVEATSIMRLIKGLFKFGLRLLVDRGSRLSSNRSLLSSSDLVKKCSYPEFWLLTLNKMVTRPWSHFKFNLFCDSVTYNNKFAWLYFKSIFCYTFDRGNIVGRGWIYRTLGDNQFWECFNYKGRAEDKVISAIV